MLMHKKIIHVLLGLSGLLLILAGCGDQRTVRHSSHVEMPAVTPMLSTSTATVVAVDLPRHLLIPAIHVDAAIEPVGITDLGDMDTPGQNPWQDVGWYSDGRVPGEHGSSVIDGHLDRPGGAPAVFWSLRELRPGDEIIVTLTSGKTLHFRVQHLVSYAPGSAPLQDIFANTAGTYLNLITCAGTWIPAQHQTTQRLVVYASLS